MKHQSSERNYKDPVCGMEVSRMSAIDEYTYQGKTYYFCAGRPSRLSPRSTSDITVNME